MTILEGPISNINEYGTITVLGQSILTDLNTLKDDSCPSSLDNQDIASLTISGSYSATGVITATRISCKTSDDVEFYLLSGHIQELNEVNSTFKINNLLINYQQATINLDSTLRDGLPVEVKGDATSFNEEIPTLTATTIKNTDDIVKGSFGDHYEVTGFTKNISIEQIELFIGPFRQQIVINENTLFFQAAQRGPKHWSKIRS